MVVYIYRERANTHTHTHIAGTNLFSLSSIFVLLLFRVSRGECMFINYLAFKLLSLWWHCMEKVVIILRNLC